MSNDLTIRHDFGDCSEVNILSLSGGKDSTAMLLLAIERETENLRCIFADTGNEHPITYEYIDYLESKVGLKIRHIKADYKERIEKKRQRLIAEGAPQEKIDGTIYTGNPFLDMAIYQGRFPSTRARFCTIELKQDVIKKQVFDPVLAEGDDIESWQGIRWDESKSRQCAKEHDLSYANKDTGAEVWNYRPILSWTADDCFAMMKKHGVEPNPLYKLGCGRVGCMPCINCRKSELAQIGARFPEQVARIEEWEAKVHRVCPLCTFFSWKGDNGSLSKGIRSAVEWAKTDRGGRQFGLFDDWENLPMCQSNYGLCEMPS